MNRYPDKSDNIYRPEIDGLRAVAVLAVITHHFFNQFLPSGYLGVDVFFVISGFVITSYFVNAPKFSAAKFLKVFYIRRVKRLLPALFICVLLTAYAFMAVTTRPPSETFATGALALFGLSNIFLWTLSQDYFALDSQLNPFTQTWSLGVEEQFYLVYPAMFVLFGHAWSRNVPTLQRFENVLLMLTAASLVFLLIAQWSDPNAAFYLIPARIWELTLGALSYLFVHKYGTLYKYSALAPLCFAVLLTCFFAQHEFGLITSLLTVASTAVLLSTVRGSTTLRSYLSAGLPRYIGKISYSLYLWHWSVLVLGKWTIGATMPALVMLLPVTFFLAIASFHLIEDPLRRSSWPQVNIFSTVFSVALLAAGAYLVFFDVPARASLYNNNLAEVLGVLPVGDFPDVPCHGRAKVQALEDSLSTCLTAQRTDSKPNVLTLLGDSHAAQLYPMAVDAVDKLPFSVRFMNTEDTSEFPYGFIDGKRESAVTDAILANARAGDVIAIAFHRGHLNESRDQHIPLEKPVTANDKSRRFVAGMRPLLEALVARGALVVLVNDTPLMNVVSTSSACLLQIRLFGESICRVSKAQDLHTRKRQDDAFAELTSVSDRVLAWDPAPIILGGEIFFEVADSEARYLMWDWNHISEHQSRLLAPRFHEFLKGICADAGPSTDACGRRLRSRSSASPPPRAPPIRVRTDR